MLKFIIIDPDENARSLLKGYFQYVHDIQLVGEAVDMDTALSVMATRQPDIVFLNIDVQETNYTEWIRDLHCCSCFVVIVTTTSESLAKRAFDLGAVDFLLKPYNYSRFIQSIYKAGQLVRSYKTVNADDIHADRYTNPGVYKTLPLYLSYVTVKVKSNLKIINTDDIFWLKAYGNYSKLFLEAESYLLNINIGAVSERLHPERFIRIHRSQIVNVQKIKGIHSHFNGEFKIVLHNGHELKVSRTYKEHFSHIMGIF